MSPTISAVSDLPVRVTDLGDSAATASCSKLLADAGLQVTVLEPPSGSRLRDAAPRARNHEPESSSYLYLSSGKRVVTLSEDRNERARQIADHVRASQIVIHDLTNDVATRDGLAFEDLIQINPSLTVVAITGFGSTGPSAGRPASDLTIYASSGHLLLTGLPDREPILPYGHQPQLYGGLLAAVVASAAEWRSHQDGAPRFVEVSLQEALAGALDQALNGYVFTGRHPVRHGNRILEDTPLTDLYATKDGHVQISIYTETQWHAFCELVGRPEWWNDTRLKTWAGRKEHSQELLDVMQTWFANRTSAAALAECQQLRIPIGIVSSVPQLLTDPQLLARGFFRKIESNGSLVAPGLPYHIEMVAEDESAPRSAICERSKSGRNHKPLPLEGITVVDFTHAWAGPFGSMQLAFLGAKVVKIESAEHPDGTRYMDIDPEAAGPVYERGGYFQEWNRNKLSLVINLAHSGAVDLMHEVLDRADIFISNYSARVVPKWGLDWQVNKRRHPHLIQVTMPAFGSQGPYRDFVAYGEVLEGAGGLAALSGYTANEPVRSGIAYADPVNGLYGAFAAVLGLQIRSATGGGAWFDLSHQEGVARLVGDAIIHYQRSDQELKASGNDREDLYMNLVLRCSGDDNWIAITAADEPQWKAVARTVGIDPQAADRGRHALAEWVKNKDKFEVAAILENTGAAVAPVLSIPELLKDAHLNARGFFAHMSHPMWGEKLLPRAGFTLDHEKVPAAEHAPIFDSDTDSLLRDMLGKTPAEIADLRRRRIVGGQPATESPMAP